MPTIATEPFAPTIPRRPARSPLAELEETLDTSAYSTWTDAKARAAESYARGDFVAAAGLFAVAAAMIDPTSGEEDPGTG